MARLPVNPDPRVYHVLFVRESGRWAVEFGDHDKHLVVAERVDWLDHYDGSGKRRRGKDAVVLTVKSSDQWRIDAILSALDELGVVDLVKYAVKINGLRSLLFKQQ